MNIFAPEPSNDLLTREVLNALNRIDYCVDYRRSGTLPTQGKDRPDYLHLNSGDHHHFCLPNHASDVWSSANAEGIRFDLEQTFQLKIEMDRIKPVEVTMRCIGDFLLVCVILSNQSEIRFVGLRSSMTSVEMQDGTMKIYDLNFENFHLIERIDPPNDGRPAI